MNLSDITFKKSPLFSEHLNNNPMPWIVMQSPGKSPQFTEYLSSMHLKGDTQPQRLKWWGTPRSECFCALFDQTVIHTSQQTALYAQ